MLETLARDGIGMGGPALGFQSGLNAVHMPFHRGPCADTIAALK
jgi:hypothetical protein